VSARRSELADRRFVVDDEDLCAAHAWIVAGKL